MILKKRTYTKNYFIDLDNFKNINETLGPVKASMCLSSYISELKSNLKSGRYKLYRLGGDEFILSTQDPLESKVFNNSFEFEKLPVSASAVSLNIEFYDKINIEDELAKGQFRVKKFKREKQRNRNYDLFVG